MVDLLNNEQEEDGVVVLGSGDVCVGGLGARAGSELGYAGLASIAT